MNIPLKVINRLRLGRSVATEVEQALESYRAWVHIEPKLRVTLPTTTKLTHSSQPLWTNEDIEGGIYFEVRYIRINKRYFVYDEVYEIYYGYDLERAWEEVSTLDERYYAASEEELVKILSRWLEDFALLRDPVNVNYPTLPNKPRTNQ